MMTNTAISNADDLIDSRDVIARIEQLADDLTAIYEAEVPTTDEAEEERATTFDQWLAATIDNADHASQDDATEYRALMALADEAEGYAADWRHGETLIRDSYFKEYAEQLADDIGAIDAKAGWPNNCIDWDKAASELQQDYTAVEFDGVTYWIR